MINNIVLTILIMVSLFIGLIKCDNPLINFIEPLSRNDDKVTVYGRFLGNTQKEINVQLDLKNVTSNIKEWSNTRIVIELSSLPSPKYSNITITTNVNSVSYIIHYMNPTCLGIDVCNGHGICINNQTSCLCNEPWSGNDCSIISGDSMISIMNSNSNSANSKFTNGVFTIPNVFSKDNNNTLNSFNTSVGIVLKEISINGYTLNSYLLSPSIQFGAITGRDFQVYRYRTNTLISSTDKSFNCDITLTHYLANQTKSIADQYIFEIKDSIGLVVIVNGHTSISHTNKLQLLIYPMINGNDQSSSLPSKSSIILNDEIKSTKMSIGKNHLKTSCYNFGLIPNNVTRFNTSIVEVKNNTSVSSKSGLYSIISIETLKSYKYIYFSTDFYPHIDTEQEINNTNIVDPLIKLSIFNNTSTYEQQENKVIINSEESNNDNNNNINLSNNTILNNSHSEQYNNNTSKNNHIKIFINFTNLVILLFILF